MLSSFRQSVRSWGAGRLLYHLYHHPLGLVRESLRQGGPWEQWKTAQGRLAMEKAAGTLPVPEKQNGPGIDIHLLSGKRFWYQSAFCLWSLALQSRRPLNPYIYDDGTLSGSQQDAIKRLFPETIFLTQTSLLEKLDRLLPESRFPVLRDRWRHYPNIRKLTDPHLGSSGWKLVLDSDLLFFRRPSALLDWVENPALPFHAVDCTSSYGYSRSLLNELAGAPLAERVNVGLCGLNSNELDWEQLEFWCEQLILKEGTSYYLEQALVAMLVAGRTCTIAREEDYVTLPPPPEAVACNVVMHHYVAESKRYYFRNNWKLVLSRTEK